MGDIQTVILPRLWPTQMNDLGIMSLAIWRYVTLLLLLLVLFMQPEGSTFYNILLGASAIFIVMDSIWVFSRYQTGTDMIAWENHNENLGTLLIRILSFAFIFYVAAGTKNKKARGWAILTGALAATYWFTTWFVYQRV
jgi:hypothetical protein